MGDGIYGKLAGVLDRLPQGFPQTESRVEMQLLRKIFAPEEAELFCELKLILETAEQIAERTGRSRAPLEQVLNGMIGKGLIEAATKDGLECYRLSEWLSIHDYQILFQDPEYARLSDEYLRTFMPEMMRHEKPFLRTLPIESQIPDSRETMTFDRVSSLIESKQSFGTTQCACRLGKRMVGEGCDHALSCCLFMSPEPHSFQDDPFFDEISKEKAYEVLREAEESGLVHQVSNTIDDRTFICNCCGCCCQFLVQVNRAKLLDNSDLVNSSYHAEIDPDDCSGCGICADERCQVQAIEELEDVYRIDRKRCIGCGLCTTGCPTDAIHMLMKRPEELPSPAQDEVDWMQTRARARGVDIEGLL